MQPLVFEPLLKRIRWGGTRLGSLLGKPLGPETDYAESWEIADHGADQSRVSGGPLHGRTLQELLRQYGSELLGRQSGMRQFPLLIKYLDAHDWLSLQVHPNDQQARQYHPEEQGKTEAWVIIDARPDSRICAGLQAGVTAQDLREALQRGRVEECLHIIGVRPGDCVYVPAGTVHALGPGIVLAEIQQQSNLTFRLYDWGRLGTDGQPRPVHLEESLACTDFARGPVQPVRPQPLCDQQHPFEELVRCPYFVIRRHTAISSFEIRGQGSFRIIMTLSGRAVLQAAGATVRLQPGSTVLVPADCAAFQIVPETRTTLLEVLQP